MSHLLDVNALIALAWPTHEHYPVMTRWFQSHANKGWATNAITQNGFVRIGSQQAFAGSSIAIAHVGELLMHNVAHEHHRFTHLDFGFEAVLGACTGGLLGHRQLTDAWLLTAAIRHRMKLLTFDHGIEQLLATQAERSRHITLLQ